MQIGIIGAGAIGGNLARMLVERGHDVSVANSRGPESLADLADGWGADAVTVEEAARARDLVILSIPQKAVEALSPGLFAKAAQGAVIVDTGNYYPEMRDGRIEAIDGGLLDSQWVAKQVGHPVIKAFNNIGSASLVEKGAPAGAPSRVALSAAGDDIEAKAMVMRLIDQLGFAPVDGGTLEESWRQQPGTPAYCHDLDEAALKTALAAADRSRLGTCRAEADEMAKSYMAERGRLAAAKG